MGETERSRAEVGVWLLAGLAFVVGTVELVVAGVLDELAASFAVSQGRAGLLMSLYALVYALLGPLLVYLSAGIERRRLLAGALLAFIGANLASAAAPSFALLLASRLLVAASASVIVVVAITLAVAIVAPERRGRAIGLVFAGIVASLVLGVPLGTLIGEFWGWRSLFLLLAGVALLGLPLLLRLLPAIRGAPGIAPAEQLRALARGRVPFAHLASLLQMTGQFTVYTYIVPFLVGSMALDKSTISLVLLVYGGAAASSARCSADAPPTAGRGRPPSSPSCSCTHWPWSCCRSPPAACRCCWARWCSGACSTWRRGRRSRNTWWNSARTPRRSRSASTPARSSSAWPWAPSSARSWWTRWRCARSPGGAPR